MPADAGIQPLKIHPRSGNKSILNNTAGFRLARKLETSLCLFSPE
jgi:hypothetical protein